jgi:hypothetical protein
MDLWSETEQLIELDWGFVEKLSPSEAGVEE